MTQVLIVEDEDRIASFIARGLSAAGLATVRASTAREGFDLAMTADPDLVILDLGLPDAEGYDVLTRLRGSGNNVPVIILTARTSLDDTVAGLESGADDYLGKPFRFEELLARVRLRLRAQKSPEATTTLRHGGLSLDLRSRAVEVQGRAVELSAREFSLLETFLTNPGRVLSREQLLSRVWGYDFEPESNVVDVYVRYLRNKIGRTAIETVRGAGYRLGPGRDAGADGGTSSDART